MTVGLADLYDRFQALGTLERRARTLAEEIGGIVPRVEELALTMVRLGGRIETVKAETRAEFYRHAGSAPSRAASPAASAALPLPRKARRRR